MLMLSPNKPYAQTNPDSRLSGTMIRSLLRIVLVLWIVASAVAKTSQPASLSTTCPRKSPPFGAVLAAHKFRGGAKRSSSSKQSKGEGPLVQFVHTITGAKKHLVSAAFARCVSIFAMYPVDSIKTRIQMSQANPLRLVRSGFPCVERILVLSSVLTSRYRGYGLQS